MTKQEKRTLDFDELVGTIDTCNCEIDGRKNVIQKNSEVVQQAKQCKESVEESFNQLSAIINSYFVRIAFSLVIIGFYVYCAVFDGSDLNEAGTKFTSAGLILILTLFFYVIGLITLVGFELQIKYYDYEIAICKAVIREKENESTPYIQRREDAIEKMNVYRATRFS